MLDWCLTRATSRLFEMNHGACKRAYAKHGNKSQNHLAKSAIVEICRGNDGLAKDLIKACQCHNLGVLQNTWNTWPAVRKYAINHKICKADIAARMKAKPAKPKTPQPNGPLQASCICQYSSGVGAWFTFQPVNYGKSDKPVTVTASSCTDTSICQRFAGPGGEYLTYYTGTLKLNSPRWQSQTNLVTGYQIWGVSGKAD